MCSPASLQSPATGYGIPCAFRLFDQLIQNGLQMEIVIKCLTGSRLWMVRAASGCAASRKIMLWVFPTMYPFPA